MSKKILMVEDDVFILSTIAKVLEKEKFEVFLAKTVDEAEQLLSRSKPDLVLLDLILPEKSGFDLLKKIKSDPKSKDTQVMIFSNLSSKKDLDRALSLGASDYMIKAMFSPEEVAAKIKEKFKL